jgi:hypothetical protein
MALKADELAAQIASSQGVAPPQADELKAYCRGLIATLKAGVVSHAVVTGVTSPGSPLVGGTAVGGVMVLTPGPWIGESGNLGPLAAAEHTAVTTYIMTGTVVFSPGTITGTCTNTPTSGGPLINGAGEKGKIIGLLGAACTAAVTSALGGSLFGPDSIKVYGAMMDYIQLAAEVTYATGSVTGVCPPGGGPLAGLAAGGIIS